ncbi:MAG: class I SAM-dependent methyltransferase [Candidatus Protochlamydia sp.]|nr:class I SAM-dependent methyltransferase [Candidatus Protochlamydia sp.]
MGRYPFQSPSEYFQLLGLNLKVKALSCLESIKVISKYYSNPAFFKIDLYLLSTYLFNSPFGLSKEFLLQKRELDIYTFGETSLTTMDLISKKCHISVRDVVYELGCGRGRTCFWLNHFIGCRVVGIDYVPAFIQRANQTKAKFNVEEVEFRLEDFIDSDFKEATFIYLYGTCYSASFLRRFIKKIEALPQKVKIITVSYPLTTYQSSPSFEVIKHFTAPFTWGTAEVYFQQKI